MYQALKNKLINYLYIKSSQPIHFEELLKANLILDEGIIPSERLLKYRVLLGRAYLSFIIIAHLFIIPAVGVLHNIFAKMDCHLSIILAVAFTGIFFATFTIYKEWLYEAISKRIIVNAWSLHFPHFEYEKYHLKVAKLYDETLRKKIPKHEIQIYILDGLAKDEEKES
ncbi:MAG: hypothetical protein ACQESH_02715 [Campylobacterota bacterium]